MAGFNFGNLTQTLKHVEEKEEGITFEDKQQTWDNAEDGRQSIQSA